MGILDAPAASRAALTTTDAKATAGAAGRVSGSMSLGLLLRDAAPKTLYSTQNPAAESVDEVGRTFIAYLGPNRHLYVRSVDNATGAVGSSYHVGPYYIDNPDDDHGAPSLTVDLNAKKIIVVWGTHGQPMAIARSAANYDITSWAITRLDGTSGKPNVLSTYQSACYDATSGGVYIAFRSGDLHSTTGAYPSHEVGSIVRSLDGGITWTDLGAGSGGLVNTKAAYSGDTATDYYGSDCDARNGRIYLSWSIAHGTGHDGPRANAYIAYYDTTDGQMHAVDGTVVGAPKINTAADFTKCRINTTAQDYVYPIHTALRPGSQEIVVGYNRYDSSANIVRVNAAFWSGTAWTITDVSVSSNYLFNGVAPAWRAGRWELACIRNVLGDNVVAQTSQKDTLAVATGGGDLVLLTSADGKAWTRDQTWQRDAFPGNPATYLQAVRNASPTLCFLVQAVDFGTIADTVGGSPDSTSEQAYYNTARWESPIFAVSATVDVPRARDALLLPPAKHYINPYYILANSATVPTAWTTLDLSGVFPRGLTEITLKVIVTGSGTSGGFLLYFRQAGTTRRDDAVVSSRGEWTDAMAFDVTVPVSPDRKIEWKCNNAALATVSLRPRTLTIAARTAAIEAGPVTVTPPTALTITATGGDGQVTVAATGGTGATSYALYRGTSATGTPIATSFPFTDTGRTNGTQVSYIATATNGGGTVTSNVASATPAVATPTAYTETFGGTTSTTSIPGWTTVTSPATILTVPDANGVTLAGTGTTAATHYALAPTAGQPKTANQYARISGLTAGTGSKMSPLALVRGAFNSTTSALTGYFVRWNGNTNLVELFKIVAGTSTSLGTFAQSTIPTSIEVRANGTSITVRINGNATDIITATDSSIATGSVMLGERYTATTDNNSTRVTGYAAGDI